MTILDYIKGDRRGREAHRMELEAMSDPMLGDALEGLDAVTGDHERAIEGLRQRIAARSARRSRRRIVRYAAAAAAVLCLAAGGVYLLIGTRAENAEGTQTIAAITPDAVALEAHAPEMAKMREEAQTVEIVDHMALPDESVEMESAEEAVETVALMESFAFVEAVTHGTIAGRVTDAEGNPMVGAAVSFNGAGTVTDVDGNFVLESADSEGTVLVSMLGYEPVKVAAMADRPLEVVLTKSGHELSDVVITGITTRSAETARAAAPQRREMPVASVLHDSIIILDTDSLRAVEEFRKYLDTVRDGKKFSGKVVLEFRVGKSGTPDDIAVVSSPGRAAEREAIRLLRRSKVAWPRERLMRVEVDFEISRPR